MLQPKPGPIRQKRGDRRPSVVCHGLPWRWSSSGSKRRCCRRRPYFGLPAPLKSQRRQRHASRCSKPPQTRPLHSSFLVPNQTLGIGSGPLLRRVRPLLSRVQGRVWALPFLLSAGHRFLDRARPRYAFGEVQMDGVRHTSKLRGRPSVRVLKQDWLIYHLYTSTLWDRSPL